MKKIFSIVLLSSIMIFLVTGKALAVKHIIQVQDFSFTPSSLSSVVLGDTIRWVWVNGSHTTTSTTIPLEAVSWDHPINSSSTSYEYIPVIAGVYNYKCSFHSSMGMVGSFTVVGPSGISDNQNIPSINIYPNPGKEIITLEYKNGTSDLREIQIYDLSGKMVKALQVLPVQGDTKTDIDVMSLPRGTFMVEFIDAAGKIETKEMVLI